jgi:ketol-acid reductoisomerase
MTKWIRDPDADLAVLAEETIAVIGYGNQGSSQAQNLRDSGLDVIVGSRADKSAEAARADGFETLPIADACARADCVLLLVPDEIMPDIYHEHVAPALEPGDLVDFASGYNVAFGLIAPPADADVVMVAPRMIGPGVRDVYLRGGGAPSFVGVHRNATGHARERMLALAKGIGATRAGCIEMSLADEATLDLFTEQGFGPAFGQVLLQAVNVLVAAGFPPEAVLLELYLSGELAYTFEKVRQVGFLGQMDFHSRTSQYGSITRSARFAHLGEPLGRAMGDVLESIRSGAFAAEWSSQKEEGAALLERIKAARATLPLAEWERRVLAVLGSRDVAESG